ncbi:MAG: hypothetical protein GQ574_20585 [Crocinitomix sp.]|nr:hypothetical protein [Crocinitomix sp.]
MNNFFTLIYIVPNRFSEEKITVGILANLDGIPYFGLSDKRLAFALQGFTSELRTDVRKGFRYMDLDVNKINRGEEALSLFDPPYSKKLLKELSRKKRGVIQYSDLFELTQEKQSKTDFDRLFKKFIGEDYLQKTIKKKTPNFNARFKEYVSSKKFADFDYNYKLKANNFPYIYRDLTVDLCRKSNYFTVFYTIDFSKSIQTIQVNISRFRLIVQSLQQVSANEGLSSGRYYLVYESTSSQSKLALINSIRNEKNLGYNIIRMTEMKDKV